MKEYRYPRWQKWLALFAVLCFGGGAVAVAGLLVTGPDHTGQVLVYLAMLLGFGWLTTITYGFLRRADNVLRVDDRGITVESPHERRTRIRWDEVATLRCRDFFQSLVLCDSADRPLLEIDYQLAEFDRLREQILAHTSHRTERGERTRVFRTARAQRVITIGGSLFLIAAAYGVFHDAEYLVMWGLIALAILVLGAELWSFRTFHIEHDHLLLGAALRERRVPFSRITDIELCNVSGNKGHQIPTVLVYLADDEPLRLSHVRKSTITLWESLRGEWEDYRAVYSSVGAPHRSLAELYNAGIDPPRRRLSPAVWALPLLLLALIGYQRAATGENAVPEDLAPLPPRANQIEDTLFRPLTLPETDPFGYVTVTVDQREVIALLYARRYAELDELLDELRDRTRADIRHESNLRYAFSAFDQSDPALERHLDAWLGARPNSSAAHIARG